MELSLVMVIYGYLMVILSYLWLNLINKMLLNILLKLC